MCIFIYNPAAGKGKVKKRLPLIIKRLEEIFGSVTVKETTQKGDAVNFAREACGVYNYLIFSGGDGTFNEIINGIAEKEQRPVLGYIPQGTTNDIAKNFRLSKNTNKALDIIAEKKAADIDIIKIVNSDDSAPSYAAYVVAGGSLVSISYATTQKRKRRWGKAAYFFDSLKLANQPIPTELECIEPSHKNLSLLLVLKSRHIAGFRINKDYAPDNGKIQVIAIKRRGKNRVIRYIRLVCTLLSLRVRFKRGDFESKTVCRFSSTHVKVDSQSNWSLDGEEGIAGELKITVLNRHIRLFKL